MFLCLFWRFKVDFQSVLRRLNGLFWFFVLKNYLRHVRLYEMYQFVTSYIVKLQFLSPAIMDVSFALDEIEERDIEVAARPGQDNISSVHVLGFVYGETGRNACPCRSLFFTCGKIFR